MAAPSFGDAWVDVHARVDDAEFAREVERGVDRAAKDADDDFEKVGKEFGETLGKSMEKELGGHGKAISESVEKAVSKEDVDFSPRWRWNRRGRNGRFISRMADDIAEDVEEAFVRTSSGAGGFFSKISQGIADAVGAGFNISGKSPLISVLIPLIGAIIGLVVAAIQGVNSLIAVVATLPALLMAVGLQAGVLFLAFKGMGTAIQGAFAANNAKELNEALKDLTPSAQKFVRTLLPLEKLFNTLQKIAQESFFKELGDVATKIQAALGPILTKGIGPLAKALGGLFRELGMVFASPTFISFFKELIPATVAWLDRFGPSLAIFLTGITAFSETVLPFLTNLGNLVSGTLFQLGLFFEKAANDPATKKWLDDMFRTFSSLIELTGGLIQFITVFMAQLNNAGGQKVIDALIDGVEDLTFLLASPVGRKALEGLIHFVIVAIQVTIGLIETIIFVMAGIEVLFEWLKHTAGPAVVAFFVMLYQGAVDTWNGLLELFDIVGKAIIDFFTMIAMGAVGTWNGLMELFRMVGSAILGFFAMVGGAIGNFFSRIWDGVKTIGEFFATLPGRILQAVANFGSLLWNAGAALIQGLVNGIAARIEYLKSWGRYLADVIASYLPGSPAEEGPLSGKGYSLYRGQRMVQDFAKGMESEIPSLRSTTNEMASSIVFGPNSIKVGFEGAVPTRQQAQTTGAGVASGIMGLAARNTRLAVRTI